MTSKYAPGGKLLAYPADVTSANPYFSCVRHLLFLIPLLLAAQAVAQHLPSHLPPEATYNRGVELFDRRQYEAAQAAFLAYLDARQSQPPHTALPHETATQAEFYAARCAYELLKYDAESRFEAFRTRHPAHPKAAYAYYYLAKLHFLKRRYDKADEELEKLDENALDKVARADATFMRGYVYFTNGEKNRAAATLQPLTEKTGPHHDKANYYYGIIRYEQGDFNAALPAFRAIEKTEDYRLKVPVYISSILLAQGMYDELKRYGDDLLKADEAYEAKPVIYQQIGAALSAQEQFAAAEKYLQAGYDAANPPSRELEYLLGQAQFEQQKYKAAAPHLEAAVEREDSLAQAAAYHLAFTYVYLKRPDDARFAFRRAYDLPFQSRYRQDAHFQYAKLSLDLKYYPDAVEAFRGYLQAYPNARNQEEASGLLAEALYYSSDYPAALAYFKQSGLRDDRTRQAYQRTNLYYGTQFLEAGKVDSAEFFLHEAAKSDALAKTKLTAQFWYAEALFRQKQYLQAAKAYNGFLTGAGAEQHPSYAMGRIGLGWCHLRLAHYETARSQFTQAAGLPGLKTRHPEVYEEASLRAGDAYFKLKDYGSALSYYNRAVQLNEKQHDYALYQVGKTQLRLQEYTAAVARFKTLVAGHPASDLRDDALLQLSDIYFTWLKNDDQAVAYAKQLLAQHPTSDRVPAGLITLGLVAQNRGNKPEAISRFKEVLERYSQSTEDAAKAVDLLCEVVPAEECSGYIAQIRAKSGSGSARLEAVTFNAARELYAENKLQAARNQFSAYIADYPQGAHIFDAYFLRGEIFTQQRDTAAALADFQKVYSTEAAGDLIGKAYLAAARLQAGSREPGRALTLYEMAAQKADSKYDRIAAEYERAALLLEMGQFDQAKPAFYALIRDEATTDYSRTRSRLALGTLYQEAGDLDSAATLLALVVKEDRNRFGAEAQARLAQVFFQQGKIETAKQAVLNTKDNFPAYREWVAEAFLVMVEIYVLEEKRLNASETLKSLVANAPNEEIRKRAFERLQQVTALLDGAAAPEPAEEDSLGTKGADNQQQESPSNPPAWNPDPVRKRNAPGTNTPTPNTPEGE